MQLTTSFVLCALTLLASCSNEAPEQAGADRDEFGCIPSAGYRWCARTNQCERPWELAREHALDDTQQAVQAFCNASPGGA